MTKHKSQAVEVSYAHATSPYATRYGHVATGCWVVEIINFVDDVFRSKHCVSGHLRRTDAETAADATGYPRGYWDTREYEKRTGLNRLEG